MEVASKVFPASIPLLEGEGFPELFVEELVDWGVGVDTGAGIAVPIPDTARGGAFLVDLDRQTLLANSGNRCQNTPTGRYIETYLLSMVKAPKPAPTRRTSTSGITSLSAITAVDSRAGKMVWEVWTKIGYESALKEIAGSDREG